MNLSPRKKLDQGDAAWKPTATILGWNIHTIRGTLQLPPHRLERLQAILHDLLATGTSTVSAWHKLLGELRSMVLAVPGGEGLFSALQVELQTHLLAGVHQFPLSATT